MNADHDSGLDEQFTARLLECDEALAAGRPPEDLGQEESPELRARLERGLACVQLLQQLRPQRALENLAEALTQGIPAEANAPSVPLAEPFCPVQIGRFQVRGILGRGGFGIVYLAYDPALDREVALKIPRADALADADCRARFQREARAAAALDHPHLVPVHEAGQLGPVCYLALAYCPGSNLADWLKQRTTPIPCRKAARLVLLLAQAIQYAHAHGVLHRDLKPSNVLLTPVAGAECPSSGGETTVGPLGGVWQPEPGTVLLPRVTDFGLAKFAASDSRQTETGAVLGTPGYMAPEQTEGRTRQVGPATDVYSLGVLLYEVVAGRPPFWAHTAVETLLQVKMTEPMPLARLRPDVPHDLETICLKCLEKEPRQRYQTAEALAEDLRRFLAGRPILARPPRPLVLALKWLWRRPALAATLVALVLVTTLGLAGILRQWHKTQEALADELTARQAAVWLQQEAEQAQQAEARLREKNEVALYHHRVALAHSEWQAGNVGRASQLLQDCRDDLRAWEHGYVRRLCHSALSTLEGHRASVRCVVFSPDGRLVASTGGDWGSSEPGDVKLWEAATGRLLWTALDHTGPVMSVAFSPDGRKLATACVHWGIRGGEVKVRDTTTGKPLHTLADVPGGAFAVAYSPDGHWLATAWVNRVVCLWNTRTGQPGPCFPDHKDSVFGVAFSPDSRLLASAGRHGTVQVWNLASGKRKHLLSGPGDLRSVEFSPDGQRLVAASYDQSVKVWDVAGGQLLLPYWRHQSPLVSAAFSPDGRWVVSGDTGGQVQVWDASSGRLIRTVRGHTGGVLRVAFSPEGRRIATAGLDRTVRLWDVTQEQEACSLPQASGARNVVFSPDGKLLAAAGYTKYNGSVLEKRVRVWSLDDPNRLRAWPGHTHWVTCVAFDPSGKLLASGSEDRTVRLWDVATGKTLHLLKGHEQMVTGVSFSPDGTRLASASLDRKVRLWDVRTGQLLTPVLTHPSPVRDVVFSPRGQRLVSCGDKGMVLVWDVATGAQPYSLPGHHDVVERVLFSPDGSRLATAGWDRAIHIWDMASEPDAGQPADPQYLLAGQVETRRITGLAFTPDGRRLASSGQDQAIRLWDVASGQETLTLRGHGDQVHGLAFSPNGRLLASGSIHQIKLWEAEGREGSPTGRILPPSAEVVLWHLQQAQECQNAQSPNWFGLAFHLSRLLEAQPNQRRWLLARAYARWQLGQWPGAIVDYYRSIELGASSALRDLRKQWNAYHGK